MPQPCRAIRRWTRGPRQWTKGPVLWAVGTGIAWLYRGWMTLVWWTSRVREDGFEAFERTVAQRRGAVVAMYHENVLIVPYAVRRYRPLTFASRADAGALIARVLEHHGFTVLRGGASRGRSRRHPVLTDLARIMTENPNRSTGIAVDGSHGPARRVKPGVVALARRVDAPLFTLHIACKPALRFPNWDRTRFPLPLSRFVVRIDGPIECCDRADEAGPAALLAEVQEQLDQTVDAAEQSLRPQARPTGAPRDLTPSRGQHA